ncbi:MAG: PadR family transcriptional regulator, partial [Solirubrobacteraceae bacterium]
MLDLAILGLLSERDGLHGYEIRRQLREELGAVTSVSFGSLYPALARLESSGAVEAMEEMERPSAETEPIPLTGSLSGELAVMRARRSEPHRQRARRARKGYRITDAGRVTLRELLSGSDDGSDPRSFDLRLAFARYLPAPARVALLERRRAQLAARLDAASHTEPGRPLDEYARCVADHYS